MECPVCGRTFPQNAMNVHVNACLNSTELGDSQEEETDATHTDDNVNIERVSNVSTKRKGSSHWGSLQPMASSRQPSATSTSPKAVKRRKQDPVVKETRHKTISVVDEEKPQSCAEEPDNLGDGASSVSLGSHSQGQPSLSSTKSVHPAAQPANSRPPAASHPQPASKRDEFAPLAERVRPKGLEHYVGQDRAVGRESMLHALLASRHVPSIILWGPPGCGKTTLARIIANNCRADGSAKFVSLSAAACGVNEVKETIKIARNDQKMFRKKTVMFLDEIHRFNKAQQDILLPHVEDGTVTLIGATTENPSFQVNSALLSRCRVVVLDKLSGESILSILQRALEHIGGTVVNLEKESPDNASVDDSSTVRVDSRALELLSNLVDGDARAALNGLQMAVQAKGANSQSSKGDNLTDTAKTSKGVVTVEDIKEGLQRSHVLYDKTGEEHYNIISALHKSMRGSDASASLYWLARMLEGGENPLYIARRLIRFACEDVGLADAQALTQAVSTYQGCHLIGMPECEVLLAQCTVYLARAPKSVEIYKAYGRAKTCVKTRGGPMPSVPLHLRNAPTKLMKSLGYAKGYKYNPGFTEPVEQDYFPDELVGTDFFA